jgi:antitoxin VapB
MPLRARLDVLDRGRLADLGRDAASVLDEAVAAVEATESEQVAAGRLVGGLTAVGLRAPVVLAAADERIERYRHPLPTEAPIRRRVMLVVVAERFGLHVAATRFREFAAPGAELRRRIEAVGEVQRALRDATRPGDTLGDCFAAAQAAYGRVGFPDEWRLHHQGGLIGYQGRERIAVPTDPTVIEPGMAFAWNPSITGTKVEETFLLDDEGRQRPILA